ncbi:flagellar biosynthesis anti-sigma factor FlgM [Vibrio ruber]|uniref:Negative regulator of flagellin synthesis n=1 Tax=Vibrio ruber (strain DSM 16370 / JCM 11486 / BCRC 17186 / CECT 7878 / LMG 23124 / VR1) TaxID=1123498 RepID=A0A1R4LEP3_VIBR1|nr:flagellar biosynthesis anti-sigma factor FlgM [Vibrio ruber]WNJ94570.1 flagellar biosynthesis anti-sigma factor FlgM [Vibrio ruber]SJN55031.1 anti-sigma28 factor FlgM [Vibrio ruber DSM 16370]
MASIDNVRSGQSLTNTSRNSTRTEHNTSNSEKINHPASSDKKDAVSLSSQSKAMGEIHSKLASSPAFDSAKVEAIKEAIANGSYRVDAEKLADNMIKFEKELDGLQ